MPVPYYSMEAEALLDSRDTPAVVPRSPYPLAGRRLEELLRLQDAGETPATASLGEAVEEEGAQG